MLELIYSLSPYAPVVIFVASALDIFFVTGLFLYGAATMGAIGMLHASGMISTEAIIVSAYGGTLFSNSLNYFTGYFFGQTVFIKEKLQHPRIIRTQTFLRTRGLFIYIITGRFITFTRPLYALILGSLHIRFYRFLIYEGIIAFLWVTFWLLIILQGEAVYFWLRN